MTSSEVKCERCGEKDVIIRWNPVEKQWQCDVCYFDE